MKTKKAKKTIMVAIQKRFYIDAIVYFEAIAVDSKEAVKQAKSYVNKHLADVEKDLEADVEETLSVNWYESEKMKVFSVGPASQYHSEADCKLCQRVNGVGSKSRK